MIDVDVCTMRAIAMLSWCNDRGSVVGLQTLCVEAAIGSSLILSSIGWF